MRTIWTLVAAAAAVVTLIAFGGWLQPRAPELFPLVSSEQSPSQRERVLSQRLEDATARLAEAQERLRELEAQLAEQSDPPDGAVPSGSSGGTAPAQVTFLDELEPASGSVDTEPTALGGVEYRHVVRLDLNACDDPDAAEFNLGKQYSRFTAKVGLRDETKDTDDRWRFLVETIGDNGRQIVFNPEIPFGEVEDLDVSVDGVLRLRLTVEEIGEARIGDLGVCSTTSDPATWAEPTLLP
ncbi:hypothetical protein BH23ACT10_BH23ACT10_20690 [soil metagenome]